MYKSQNVYKNAKSLNLIVHACTAAKQCSLILSVMADHLLVEVHSTRTSTTKLK